MNTIDLDQLSLVTGGQQQGTFERIGGTVGEAAGRWGASMLPAPVQPAGRAVLPPAGRAAGSQAGAAVDRWINPASWFAR